MTQENKELLLKDLCARLPYGVKIKLIRWDIDEGTYINTTLEPDDIERLLNVKEGDTEIKPYLFPLSSMTEEQKREYNMLLTDILTYEYEGGDIVTVIDTYDNWMSIDYLIANHFDYRYLIEDGLAIDATGLNIY